MSNNEIIRTLIGIIGKDLELDKAIKDVVLGLLELPEEPEPKKEPAKRGRPKKTEEKKTEPKKSEPKPFDTGKLKALLNGGWSVAKVVKGRYILEYMVTEDECEIILKNGKDATKLIISILNHLYDEIEKEKKKYASEVLQPADFGGSLNQ